MLHLTLLFLFQFVNIPDIKEFNPVLSKELEFRIDDYKTGFVGKVIDYQNPNNSSEFVRVYYRQVAIVSERARIKSSKETTSLNFSNLNYHQKQEKEALNRVQELIDPFAYVQWKIVRDPRTGQYIRDGFFRAWLLNQNGEWIFESDKNITSVSVSEPFIDKLSKQVLVGIKFSLGDSVHIVRIDQDDILVQEEKPQDEVESYE
ncbi:MAG: hypothetical protein COV30_00315 [Candidatus Yanofskybacteria bacterium CG10_big_fil_rev_8_21_14_0_10_37_15]|uniref:Uncharacterized protein n=1 Tax=Candidatus Yanofskybacteria bacterium CG10_big_fil_rev_8_21_14_0_10_37_15 TaxID=1975097 RepID=A0A2H0R6D3_9BACT|nr:MAG: hypothetical protein COV30_00315 [Candidatus Yanofskybacteria bacterium CG10_big_fil_rev_8_21_14_0_10_37_15]